MCKAPYRSPEKWKPAPPDPGVRPGGIRARAMQGVFKRGLKFDDAEKTKASQQYWAQYRAERGLPQPKPKAARKEQA
jgi:hypothetical protein